MEIIQNFDESVILFINEFLKCGIFDKIMPFISLLGNNGTIFILLGIILISLGGKKRSFGIILLAALSVNIIIGNVILKPNIARIRPFDNLMLDIIIKKPLDFSFPSGHTNAAVTAAAIMFYMNKKFGIVMIVFAFLMAFSRLYLLVHYPSDIIAGALIGFLGSIATLKLMRKFVFKQI